MEVNQRCCSEGWDGSEDDASSAEGLGFSGCCFLEADGEGRVERKRIKLSKNMRGGGGNWDYSSGLVENDDKEVVVELFLLESRVVR